MTIQDAMADVFLRAILKNPERFPEDLRAAARDHYATWNDRWNEERLGGKIRYVTGTFICFKRLLSASVQDLPALMGEEK